MKKLFDAKQQIPTIKKDANNPFFKSGYATLSRIIEVVEPILAKHELYIYHSLIIQDGDSVLVTSIVDKEQGNGGVTSFFKLPSNTDIQKIGSAITYAKRYNITALLNLNIEDDDDGNAVKPQTPVKNTPAKPKDATPYEHALKAVKEATDLKLMREQINESKKLTSVEKDSLHKLIDERTKK